MKTTRRFAAATVMALLAMNPPLRSAEAHVLVEHGSGDVLELGGDSEPRSIASLTKIAACLVVLEWCRDTGASLDEELVVPAAALRGGANPLSLQAGDHIRLGDALASAMMASDNTATDAMAEMVGRRMDPGAASGVSAFVERMNALAARLGMKETRFINPHGLDEGGESGKSTAMDLARLVLHAYDDGALAGFASEKQRELRFVRDGREMRVTVTNTNELVGSRGIDGLKTGTTRSAGACLIVSATRAIGSGNDARDHRLHVVVLGAGDRFREAVLLLDRGWKILGDRGAGGEERLPKQNLRKGRD